MICDSYQMGFLCRNIPENVVLDCGYCDNLVAFALRRSVKIGLFAQMVGRMGIDRVDWSVVYGRKDV